MLTRCHLTENEPVNQQVYRILQTKIANCHFMPGSALSEQDIASMFKVSRQPIREAFIRLTESYLLKIVPQRGTYVSKISTHRVKESLYIREALACFAINQGVEKISDKWTREITQSLSLLKECQQGNELDFLCQENRFHYLLLNLVDLEMTWSLVSQQKAYTDRLRFLPLPKIIISREQIVQQYQEMYDALLDRNKKRAIEVMRDNIHHQYLLQPLDFSIYPNWFE